MRTPSLKARNVVFALLGVGGLLLRDSYAGPLAQLIHSFGGNFAVSFALYFAAINATHRYRRGSLIAAGATLLAVTAFEILDGFGFMANVYDPLDLIANAAGVGFALGVDVLTAPLLTRSPSRDKNPPSPPHVV